MAILVFVGIAYAFSILGVVLSPSTPAGGNINSSSTSTVAFTTFNFTNMASSTEGIIIDKLVITNNGTSSSTTRNIFSEASLYNNDNLIATSTEMIGEDKFLFTDFSFIIPTSTAKTLTIKGILSGEAVSGTTVILGLFREEHIHAKGESTNATSTIWGNFPIWGNTFTFN